MKQGKARLMIDFQNREKMMAFVQSMSDFIPHFQDNTPIVFFVDALNFTKGAITSTNSYVLRKDGATPEQ
jgi:hypothetical protein